MHSKTLKIGMVLILVLFLLSVSFVSGINIYKNKFRNISDETIDLIKKDTKLVPFFFTARKNFDQQVQLFVGSKTLIDPTRIFLQFRDLLRPKGMLPLLVIDGLDEIASPQLMRTLLVILSSLAASQIPVIVSCREERITNNVLMR